MQHVLLRGVVMFEGEPRFIEIDVTMAEDGDLDDDVARIEMTTKCKLRRIRDRGVQQKAIQLVSLAEAADVAALD